MATTPTKKTAPAEEPKELSAQAQAHKVAMDNPTDPIDEDELEKMSYHELELLWGRKLAERHLATGTAKFAVLADEMNVIKDWMDTRNAEFNTPDRLAKAQHIGVQPKK